MLKIKILSMNINEAVTEGLYYCILQAEAGNTLIHYHINKKFGDLSGRKDELKVKFMLSLLSKDYKSMIINDRLHLSYEIQQAQSRMQGLQYSEDWDGVFSAAHDIDPISVHSVITGSSADVETKYYFIEKMKLYYLFRLRSINDTIAMKQTVYKPYLLSSHFDSKEVH